MNDLATAPLRAALDLVAESGEQVSFWLRDDDAVEPSPALDRLLQTFDELPLTLAVIPEHTGTSLARRLADVPGVSIAVHGWSHRNHAPSSEKSQELGAHRPLAQIWHELGEGRRRLAEFYPLQFVPMLVPPWNRIAPEVALGLTDLGYRSLSLFGPDKPSPLPLCNTHLDLIDWHGTRGGRPEADLWSDLADQINGGRRTVGVLSHHLVHDDAAWAALHTLVSLAKGNPACKWRNVTALVTPGA